MHSESEADARSPEARGADRIPPAGIAGRLARIVAGGYQLYFVYIAVDNFGTLQKEDPLSQPLFWGVAAFGIYLLPWAIGLGLATIRRFRRPRWYAAIALCMMLLAFCGLFGFGSAWSPLLSIAVLLTAGYVHAHVGISNLLAGVIGLPGCEMRVLPWLLGRWRSGSADLVLCPGLWTPIDRWEARLRDRS